MGVRFRFGVAIVALCVVCSTGCNTFYFEVSDQRVARDVRDRKAFFLFGLAPTHHIDVSEKCPDGVTAIRELTTFGDGLLALITLWIYTPRTTTYYCFDRSQP